MLNGRAGIKINLTISYPANYILVQLTAVAMYVGWICGKQKISFMNAAWGGRMKYCISVNSKLFLLYPFPILSSVYPRTFLTGQAQIFSIPHVRTFKL